MKELIEMIRKFNSERNWDQYHSPKNLAISISIESAELLENFQWEGPDIHQLKNSEKTLQKITEELADVFIYGLNLADKLGVDIKAAVKQKLELNREKYPISKACGSAKKYTNFEDF